MCSLTTEKPEQGTTNFHVRRPRVRHSSLRLCWIGNQFSECSPGYANALDVIYSIPAARVAVPQLGKRWAVAGCSQGGLAAVGVAEAESEVGEPNYLGAIAISGVAEAQDIFERLAQGPPTARSYFWRRESRLSFPSFE